MTAFSEQKKPLNKWSGWGTWGGKPQGTTEHVEGQFKSGLIIPDIQMHWTGKC